MSKYSRNLDVKKLYCPIINTTSLNKSFDRADNYTNQLIYTGSYKCQKSG